MKYLIAGLIFGCALTSVPAEKTPQCKIWLQANVPLTVEQSGRAIRYKRLTRDKNMSLVTFPYDGFAAIVIKGKGLVPYTISKPADSCNRNMLVAPEKDGSSLHYVTSWESGSQPKSVTFADQDRVILALLDDKFSQIVDIRTGTTLKLEVAAPWNKSAGFVESVMFPERGEFYISQMTTGAVHKFELGTWAYKGSLQTSGIWGKVMITDPARKRMFFSNWESKDVTLIDVASFRETARIPAGGVPRGMAVTDDNKRLYVCQFGKETDTDSSGQIAEVDIASGRILRTFGRTGAKRHMLRQGNVLIVSDLTHARIEWYDAPSGNLLAEEKVFSKPNTIALDPSGKWLFVSNRGPNHPEGYLKKGLVPGRISVIDNASHKLIEEHEAGNQPTGLAVSPDGRTVVLSDFLDKRIRVYEWKR